MPCGALASNIDGMSTPPEGQATSHPGATGRTRSQPEAPTGSAFHRLGLVVVRRAKLVLTVATIAIAVCAVLGVGVFGRLLGGGFDDPRSASSQATALIDQDFGGQPDLIFLVHAHSGTVDSPPVSADGDALVKTLHSDPRLAGITSYWSGHAAALRSTDGTDALALATLAPTADAAAVVASYAHLDTSSVTVRIGGPKGTDIGGQVSKDLALAEAIAVPITLLLLIIAFGSLVAALLPFCVSLVAIFGTFAALNLITHITDVSIFALNLTTALGLGLGIDYALLMVSRFREELRRGVEVPEAVARTTATAGRTIAFSAITVAAALSALLVFPVYFLKSFAYAGVAVTLLSAIAALLVLPAALAVLGHRVNAGRVPGITAVRSVEAPFWGRLATAVMRRPALAAAPVVVVLLLMATPMLTVSFGTPDDRVLPTTAPSHQVGDVLRQDFTTAPAGFDVLVHHSPSASSLSAYARQLSSLPGVQRADSSAGSFAAGRSASPGSARTAMARAGWERISLGSGLDSASPTAQALLRQVRAAAIPAGATVLVGGPTAELVDSKDAISSHLAEAAAIIVVTTFVLLFLFTGSIVQPLRALLGNALTLAATLGVMVWIFQQGHLAGLLHFTATPTNTSMPVLLFCIAFGLSMDYEVFLMSRITELRNSGSSTTSAVIHGLARTGRIITTAAALLAVSFFSFVTGHVSFIQFFGLGTGLAILIDATLVRGILVPAVMGMLGDRSWYAPAPLRRLYARTGLSDVEAELEISR